MCILKVSFRSVTKVCNSIKRQIDLLISKVTRCCRQTDFYNFVEECPVTHSKCELEKILLWISFNKSSKYVENCVPEWKSYHFTAVGNARWHPEEKISGLKKLNKYFCRTKCSQRRCWRKMASHVEILGFIWKCEFNRLNDDRWNFVSRFPNFRFRKWLCIAWNTTNWRGQRSFLQWNVIFSESLDNKLKSHEYIPLILVKYIQKDICYNNSGQNYKDKCTNKHVRSLLNQNLQ